jgi:hypothetical protein
MIHISANGRDLLLDVAGYQFPGAPLGDWDAAWLQVKGSVSCENGRWSFLDPCMTASELTTLASWLIHVATQDESSEMAFLEPCLSFRRDEADPPGAFSVIFCSEACPPWITDDARCFCWLTIRCEGRERYRAHCIMPAHGRRTAGLDASK